MARTALSTVWEWRGCMFACGEEVTLLLPAYAAALTVISFLAARQMRTGPAE